jgi:hypothetical protein
MGRIRIRTKSSGSTTLSYKGGYCEWRMSMIPVWDEMLFGCGSLLAAGLSQRRYHRSCTLHNAQLAFNIQYVGPTP